MDKTLAIVAPVCGLLGAAIGFFFRWRIFQAQRKADDERYEALEASYEERYKALEDAADERHKALEARLDKAERALQRCHRREVNNVRIRARLEARLQAMDGELSRLRSEVFAVAQQQVPPGTTHETPK